MFAFGGKEEKPLCQCPRDKKDSPCKKVAKDGSLFCKEHQHCPPAPTNGFEPLYIADTLNKDKSYLETHNCLSYALRGNKVNKDLMSQCKDVSSCNVNFEQPGAASGERKAMRNEKLRTCPVVEKLTKSDLGTDFVPTSFYKKCPAGMSKVALVVDKGSDYHWYRQDKGGWWSDKAGSNKVKNYDAKKRRLFNPAQADRDYGDGIDYDQFCGFYCVNRTKRVRLKQGGKRKKQSQTMKKGGAHKELGSKRKELGSKRKTRRARRSSNA